MPLIIMGTRTISHIKRLLIWRKSEAIGHTHVTNFGFDSTRFWRNAVNITARLFNFGALSLKVSHDAVRWVSKPNCPIGCDHHIIWRIERLSFECRCQHRSCTVMLYANHREGEVLAAYKPSLHIARVAIAVIGVVRIDFHAKPRHPLQLAIIGDV